MGQQIRSGSMNVAVALLLGCAGEVADDGAPGRALGQRAQGLAGSAMSGCVAPATADGVPDRLSDTGCYAGGAPSVALVPFDVNAPLWTDGADKVRFLSLPAGAQLEVQPDGDIALPPGGVLLKTIALDGRKLETRLWMHHADGSWTGTAYEWSSDQGEAYRVPEGDVLPEAGDDGKGWEIPSEGQCRSCHRAESNMTLGLELAQLDRTITDPVSGQEVDQLQRLSDAGLFAAGATPADAPDAPAALVDYRDERAALGDRARSYLHANCSSCHSQADGFCTGDLRWGVATGATGVCETAPKQPLDGWAPDVKLLAPGRPAFSGMALRMHVEPGSPGAMPPIGRRRVHDEGIALVEQWIASLNSCDE